LHGCFYYLCRVVDVFIILTMCAVVSGSCQQRMFWFNQLRGQALLDNSSDMSEADPGSWERGAGPPGRFTIIHGQFNDIFQRGCFLSIEDCDL
jgi:hypothetical protein